MDYDSLFKFLFNQAVTGGPTSLLVAIITFHLTRRWEGGKVAGNGKEDSVAADLRHHPYFATVQALVTATIPDVPILDGRRRALAVYAQRAVVGELAQGLLEVVELNGLDIMTRPRLKGRLKTALNEYGVFVRGFYTRMGLDGHALAWVDDARRSNNAMRAVWLDTVFASPFCTGNRCAVWHFLDGLVAYMTETSFIKNVQLLYDTPVFDDFLAGPQGDRLLAICDGLAEAGVR